MTVSGAAPVVDVLSVTTRNVLTRAVLNALPNNKTFAQYAMVTPGVRGGAAGGVDTRDVGGSQGEAPLGLTAHGSDPGLTSVDGVMTVSMGGGDWRRLNVSDQYMQEVVMQVSGGNAEAWTGGVGINVIPKDGGNQFSGTFSASASGTALTSDNLSDALKDRGVRDPSELQKLFDVGAGFGGPIIQNKLWFYAGPRIWETESLVSGNYFNKTPEYAVLYTRSGQAGAFRERELGRERPPDVAGFHAKQVLAYDAQQRSVFLPLCDGGRTRFSAWRHYI